MIPQSWPPTPPTSGVLPLPSRADGERLLVIPAAGLGSRLQSDLPKLLVPVGGQPMIRWLVELYRPWVARIVLIVSPAAMDRVSSIVSGLDVPIDLEVQAQPTGMLDAVLLAEERVRASSARHVWITWCDQIGIDPRTVRKLADLSRAHADAAVVMPTATRRDPYIHLQRDATGRIVRVLQRREGDALPPSGESDAGLFGLSREAFLDELPRYAQGVTTGNGTGERNLLPFIPWVAAHRAVVTFPCVEEIEAVGINTPEELTQIEAHLSRRQRMLSIVIPAYNEERFIGTLLDQIKAVDLSPLGIGKEIIVVDDCSKDATAAIVERHPDVVLRRMERNGGKGRAVRAGIAAATGEFLIIQDADLEYDPNDYVPMIEALLSGRGDVVYGSRYLRSGKHDRQSWAAYLGGRSLSLIALAMTGHYLTDTVTALKLFSWRDIAGLPLETSGFELDHEITSRMFARGKRIVEVPISYQPRSREEGKKIGLRDWFIGARTFWRYRHG